MNLNIIQNNTQKKDIILIGKTGQIRIKSEFAKGAGLNKNDRWEVANDMDETGPERFIYLLKCCNTTVKRGKKMVIQKSAWSLDVKMAVNQLSVSIPMKSQIEIFKNENIDALRFKISI
jgi:hypothetical protein